MIIKTGANGRAADAPRIGMADVMRLVLGASETIMHIGLPVSQLPRNDVKQLSCIYSRT